MSKRALLSVSDKRNISVFAKQLIARDYEIISTGGTAKELQKHGIAVTSIESVTGFPECFGGRVKTMHPALMGGILFKRSDTDHVTQAKEHNIQPIDVVVVNLYPFAQTLEKGRAEGKIDDPAFHAHVIEQIDIGGPTLLRSAAKNHEDVVVVCDPADYDRVIAALETQDVSIGLKRELAAKVFTHTAAYDALIAAYLSTGQSIGLMMTHGRTLRYGENPHQKGIFYALADQPDGWKWTLHQGKELSYLNLLDADGAWQMACDFTEPTCVMVKHANPSGIASHTSIDEAFQRAYDTDRLSAFGVIIALNRPCTEVIAKKIIDQKIFVELILAPAFEKSALEILQQKPNIRVIDLPMLTLSDQTVYRSAFGGMLVQNADAKTVNEQDLKMVTDNKPSKDQIADLLFAWKCVKHAKSNAIVFVKDRVTVGIGAGQTSRVDSTWIAAKRAGERAKGAVMASDAFFPFPDSIQEAAKHGISAIIQPGGSVKDAEVIAAANSLGIAMVMTGVRAFRH